jgi:type IV pilus assembly protein PilA
MNRKTSHADRHRARRTVAPSGFTLMELLIVMAIITILILLFAASFPSYLKHARQLSAKKSLQDIYTAQITYESDYPANGYACKLSDLGGDPSAGPATPTGAHLIPPSLASGVRNGYIFAITNCTKVSGSGTDRVSSYEITAVPESPGKSGDLGYCIDAYGTLKQDPMGGINCTQPVE